MSRMLRTIRLDVSDTFAFEKAAEPGEWAVPGSFMFWDHDAATLSGQAPVAFRSGWLGLGSFGWSTLAVRRRGDGGGTAAAVEALARHLVDEHGAPGLPQALAAADEEIAFAESCADHPEQTLVVIHRTTGDDGGIREQFRTVKAGLPFNKDGYSRVLHVPRGRGRGRAGERVDLATLAEKRPV